MGPPPPPPDVAVDATASTDAGDAPDDTVDVGTDATTTATAPEPAAATPPATEVAPPTTAATRDAAAGEPSRTSWLPRTRWLTISGYVQPQFTYRVRLGGRARDQREIGAGDTRAGLIFAGEPLPRWGYTIHVVIGGQLVNAVTDADAVDSNGDGNVDDVAVKRQPVAGLFVEKLSARWRPVDLRDRGRFASGFRVDLELGQLRIPFTAQNRTMNFALMFPGRSVQNDLFLSGTDLGALLQLGALDDRIEASAGVFNGTGLAISRSNERGALVSGRVDINPLGGFAFAEGDLDRGKPRFGLGGGLLYFPSRQFDAAGSDTRTQARDLRASASARLAARGFYLQGEYFRRQRTDSLSSRPLIHHAAYVQASYFIPLPRRTGLAPGGRFGWTTTDVRVSPRTSFQGEAGLSFYIANAERPDGVRVLALYQAERRVTEHQRADGATVQVQLRF